MKRVIPKWQRGIVRKNIEKYKGALENYYIKNKQIIDVEGGYKAFSLLSPPLLSPVSRRRMRFIMNNIMEQEMRGLGGKNIPKTGRTPHFVTMAITYNCQCDCSHCSAALYKERTKAGESALNYEELRDAIKQTIALGATSIVFTGGEPLIHSQLFDLIRCVDRTKAVCTVFTNGEYLTEESVAELKKAGTFGVFVSFDFSEPEKHNQNRKRNNIFQKACDGIKLCQKNGILTGISTFVTKEKLESGEMDRMIHLAKDLNVLEVFVFDVIPTGKLKDKQECLLGENDFEQISQLRERYNQMPDFPRIIHQTMLTSIAYPCTGEGCPAGTAHMHLRANGDVSPCDFTPFSFGNIRRNSLKEIWDNISGSDLYEHPSKRCRLSNPELWEKIENNRLALTL